MQSNTHRRSGRARLRATGGADCLPDPGDRKIGAAQAEALLPRAPHGRQQPDDVHNHDPAPAGMELSAKALSRPAERTHRVAAQSVLEALTRGDLTAYAELAVELKQQLGSNARWGLAWAALMACDDEEACTVIDAVFTANESMGGE